MNRLGIAALVAASVCAAQTTADAFCGFYVAGGDQQMFNDATQVVLMRHGTKTVLSMQNNYKGPPSAFAMVIPVPVVLKESDVKTLPRDAFAAIERMGAPRLVEYWEVDPCFVQPPEAAFGAMRATGTGVGKGYGAGGGLGVKIEAKFTVGEYQIVILSAKDSTGLDTWLRQEKYNIPPGAEPLLRPYVESGQKFFVAKVDPSKVKFEGDRAALSPLRFHYESDQFNLPIRLGLANSSGKQDLIVNILAPNQRYEVSNYKNVTIPTNITVNDSVKEKFGAFYTALFDATIEKNPGAVVTEYAWQAIGCDPCPGPMLDQSILMTLGLDVIEGRLDGNEFGPAPVRVPGGGGRGGGWGGGGNGLAMNMVLTRLHARYGKDITNDLEFKAAPGIVGGREFVVDPKTQKLEEGAQPSGVNNFQGRYAIRHAWDKPITCNAPVRNRWGGPWPGVSASPTTPALGLAFAPRGGVQLAAEVKQDVPELGIKFGTLATMTPPPTTPATTPTTPGPTPGSADATPPPKAKTGCGCGTTGDASPWLGLGLAALLLRRKRRVA